MLLNGIVSGLSMALLAVSFQLVYLPTRIFYIGLAGLYVLVPYICKAILAAGAPIQVAIVGAVLSAVALAVGLEWGSHARLARRRAAGSVQLVASLGSYIVLIQLVTLMWGTSPQVLRPDATGTIAWGGAIVSSSQVVSIVTSTALLIILPLTLRIGAFGLRLRALADNPDQFALMGYNVDWHRRAAFGLSGLVGAASALCAANDGGFAPNSGLQAVLLAVVAVIVGGRSSYFAGPIVGGLVLGVLRSLIVWNLSAQWQESVTLLLLAAFLLIRPRGILGSRGRLEEAEA